MKNIVILIVLLFPVLSFSQESTASKNAAILNWRKSIVHINMIEQKYLNAREGEIAIDKGTATLFVHNNRKYLLTARHNVLDTTLSQIQNKPVYKSIFIEPPFETIVDDSTNKARFLINSLSSNLAGAIAIGMGDEDIAVIALQSKVAKDLLRYIDTAGYQALSFTQLNDALEADYVSEIFAFGFPYSHLGNPIYKKNGELLNNLPYIYASDPFVTHGKVSLLSKYANYFYADMANSPGFSGGPVIQNNKIIGVISGTMSYSPDIPLSGFTRIIKLSNLKRYLIELENK